MAQRQDVSRATLSPALTVVHRTPGSWGTPWWREAVPLSLRNWGLVAEMLHYLQVAPFPKKLFRH